MAERGRYLYREVLLFVTMVMLQCAQVGLNTVFKAATNEGMSYRVFIVYSYALSGIFLLPFSFFVDRRKELPPFDMGLIGRIWVLGFVGFAAQMLAYQGIEYSSPTLTSAISNLTPAFTFALAIAFRMEKLALRSLSSQAKIVGAIVSIAGALVVVLYQGPIVVRGCSSSSSKSLYLALRSPQSNWIIGGALLTANCFVLSLWYIIQAKIVAKYPAELLLVALYALCVAIIATPVTFILEPNLSAWKITTKMMLSGILYSGLIGTSFATVSLTWGLRLKGPVYVALFTPLSIVIAAFMSVIFLGDSLYMGSVVGGIIISVGFYVCMWGKAKEIAMEVRNGSLESPSPENAPLLQ